MRVGGTSRRCGGMTTDFFHLTGQAYVENYMAGPAHRSPGVLAHRGQGTGKLATHLLRVGLIIDELRTRMLKPERKADHV